MAKSRRLPPVHPGEILPDDLMAPLGLSINKVARDLRVPVTRMSEIVNGRRSITADTALRLARYFSPTPEFWVNLQTAYHLDVATTFSLDCGCSGDPERDRIALTSSRTRRTNSTARRHTTHSSSGHRSHARFAATAVSRSAEESRYSVPSPDS